MYHRRSSHQAIEVRQGLAHLKQITNEWRMGSDPAGLALGNRKSPQDAPSMEAEIASPPTPAEPRPQSQPKSQSRQRNPHPPAPTTSYDATLTTTTAGVAKTIDHPLPWTSKVMNHMNDMSTLVQDRLSWSANTISQEPIGPNIQNSGAGAGPWPDPPPDPWLQYFDTNVDSTSDLQWESLFRDLGNHQFTASF